MYAQDVRPHPRRPYHPYGTIKKGGLSRVKPSVEKEKDSAPSVTGADWLFSLFFFSFFLDRQNGGSRTAKTEVLEPPERRVWASGLFAGPAPPQCKKTVQPVDTSAARGVY